MYCGAECKRLGKKGKAQFRKTHSSGAACSADACAGVAITKGLCRKHYARMRAHGDVTFSKRGLRVEKACEHCGAVMRLKPAEARERRVCGATCAALIKAKESGLNLSQPHVVHCGSCGCESTKMVRHGRPVPRYCSKRCFDGLRARLVREREALERIAERNKWRPSPAVLAEVAALRRIARYVQRPAAFRCVCRECQASMTVRRTAGGHARMCEGCKAAKRKQMASQYRASPAGRAARTRMKALRRARIEIAAEAIDPFVVFTRDKWTCQLCGVTTPRKLRGTYEPTAPELDHVVPLALGGSHTWGNVQCACRRCNGIKGANAMGQMGLSLVA
jgi:5-methylcytosine-specific restriction endonuclease McrA